MTPATALRSPNEPVSSPLPVSARHGIRVMHLLWRLGVAGTEVGVVKLSNALASRGFETCICSFVAPIGLEDVVDPRVEVCNLAHRDGTSARLIWRLSRIMRRVRPDILHTHSWGTLCEGMLAAKLAGIERIVHGEHGTLESRPLNLHVQRWAWRRANQVLSVSSRLAEHISTQVGFPLDRIRVIRNGVDLERFSPGDRRAARMALGLEPHRKFVGTVGRLVPVKSQRTLIQAIAILASRQVDCSAILVGEGPLREPLKGLAAQLGVGHLVHLLGQRNDVHRVLPSLDVFALPSLSEGLSNTIIEAMATGLPVVSTRVGGADELVREGETGHLVPPDDPQALADALARILTSGEHAVQMGSQSLKRARQQFGLDRMVSEYEELYLTLLR